MAKIKNIDGVSLIELNQELQNGGKFVVFQYCISVVFMTFKRGSNVYFIRAGESTSKYSYGFTFLSFIMGWWGIPWGPIYTIGSLYRNLSGGKNVTNEVLAIMNKS